MNTYLKDQLEENLKSEASQKEKQARIDAFVNSCEIEIFGQELKLALSKIKFSVEEQIMRGSTNIRVDTLNYSRNSDLHFITTNNEIIDFMRQDSKSSDIDIRYDGLPYVLYEEFENWVAENGLVLNLKKDMHDDRLTLQFSPFNGETD